VRRAPVSTINRFNALRATELGLSFPMPTETSIANAEDLKARVLDLRRFL